MLDGTRSLACDNETKHASVFTTGSPDHTGIPCAMVLRLLRDLPGVPGLLATIAC